MRYPALNRRLYHYCYNDSPVLPLNALTHNLDPADGQEVRSSWRSADEGIRY